MKERTRARVMPTPISKRRAMDALPSLAVKKMPLKHAGAHQRVHDSARSSGARLPLSPLSVNTKTAFNDRGGARKGDQKSRFSQLAAAVNKKPSTSAAVVSKPVVASTARPIAPPPARATRTAPAPAPAADAPIAPASSLDLTPVAASSPAPMEMDDDDVAFGAQESFAEWLARVRLRGPRDPPGGADATRISETQRATLESTWANAAEADALRRLVENLKDSELEMARKETLAASGWAADFEAATAAAWSEKVDAAARAASDARKALGEKERETADAEAAASSERCAALAASVETGALRGKLQEAMLLAESGASRAATLEAKLAEISADAEDAREALERKRSEAQRANAAEYEALAKLAAVETARARDRVAHEKALAAAREGEAKARIRADADADAFSADAADGARALKAALALREREVADARASAAEVQCAARALEEKVAALERTARDELKEALSRATKKMESKLASATRRVEAAEAAEAVAEEELAKTQQEAKAAVAAAEAKAAAAVARATSASASAASVVVDDAKTRELEAALLRETAATEDATRRATAAEAEAKALRRELDEARAAASQAAGNVAEAIAAVRAAAGGGGGGGAAGGVKLDIHVHAAGAAAAAAAETEFGAFYTLVPIRPRSRGGRRSLRTFAGASLLPPLAFNPRPRRLSTPTDAFQLHPDVRLYRTALFLGGPVRARRRGEARARARARGAPRDARRGARAHRAADAADAEDAREDVAASEPRPGAGGALGGRVAAGAFARDGAATTREGDGDAREPVRAEAEARREVIDDRWGMDGWGEESSTTRPRRRSGAEQRGANERTTRRARRSRIIR